MFNGVSMTGTGIAVFVVWSLLKWAGVNMDESMVEKAVDAFLTFGSFILLVVGQLKRKDLKWGFWRN